MKQLEKQAYISLRLTPTTPTFYKKPPRETPPKPGNGVKEQWFDSELTNTLAVRQSNPVKGKE